MISQFSRSALLLGDDAIKRLNHSRVAVFGIGGVGGYVCEALVRCGVGSFDLIDNDTVSLTNLNRQIIALHSTVGRYKTEVMKERMLDINPQVQVRVHNCFYLPETASQFDFSVYDYVVDAVDTVAAKLSIILEAQKCSVPVISSMGAGNKLDPSRFRVADIYQTDVDPLARVMRRELKKRGVDRLKVVYSDEKPLTPAQPSPDAAPGTVEQPPQGRRALPGSLSFVPSAAGLVLAGEIVKDLTAASDLFR